MNRFIKVHKNQKGMVVAWTIAVISVIIVAAIIVNFLVPTINQINQTNTADKCITWLEGQGYVVAAPGDTLDLDALTIGGVSPFGILGADGYVMASDTPTLTRVFGGFLDLLGFNVAVCDGTADEVEINAVIDGLPTPETGNVRIYSDGTTIGNQGGLVQLSAGWFNLATSINATSNHNLVLQGNGPATVINNANVAGAHAIVVQGSNPLTSRVTLKDFLVQGNALSGDGIHITAGNFVTADNIHSISNGSHGWYQIVNDNGAMPTDENKTITNSFFMWNAGWGIVLERTHETIIDSNHIEENTGGGLWLKGAIDPIIKGNNIEDNGGTYQIYMGEADAYKTTGGDLTLTGNIIEGNLGFCCSADYQVSSVVITGNKMPSGKIVDVSGGGSNYIDAINITGNYIGNAGGTKIFLKWANDVSITGNTLTGSAFYGAVVIEYVCDRLTITGNDIDVGSPAIKLMRTPEHVTIGDNTIYVKKHQESYGIWIYDHTGTYTPADINIHDNMIISYGGADQVDEGVRLDGNTTRGKIHDNTIEGFAVVAINDISGVADIDSNEGFVTENSGSATVTNGNTTVVVAHGLALTPVRVQITPKENPTNPVTFWWVDTVGAANFTINISADPGASNLDFDWRATVGEGN